MGLARFGHISDTSDPKMLSKRNEVRSSDGFKNVSFAAVCWPDLISVGRAETAKFTLVKLGSRFESHRRLGEAPANQPFRGAADSRFTSSGGQAPRPALESEILARDGL